MGSSDISSSQLAPRGALVLATLLISANLILTCFLVWRPSFRPPQLDQGDLPAPSVELLLKDLSQEIGTIGDVSAANVVDVAQLWRRSQLALEAAALDGRLIENADGLAGAAARLADSLVVALPPLVTEEHAAVRAAPTLRDGLSRWARAGALLALFPDAGQPELAAKAQELAYEHELVRQRLLGKHQVRYNLWACSMIKKAWVDIKEVNAPVSTKDNEKFLQSCLHFLGPVDTSLLDVATGELYRDVLGFVRERLSREYFQTLVEGLANAKKLAIDELEP